MNTEEWLADIGRACDELGYGILGVRPGSIEVGPLRGQWESSITIRSVLLSGNLIRSTLLPAVPRVASIDTVSEEDTAS